MKKILITGERSYIGRSFMKYCEDANEDFFVQELSVRGDQWKNTNFSKFDTVFHVAGVAHSSPRKKQAPLYYAINRDLAIEVAIHAKKSNVKQFIFMSSAIVYNDSNLENGKVTEDTEPKSANFYGDSKIQAEEGLVPLRDDKFKIAILRPPMVYGKDSKGNYPVLATVARKIPVFPDYTNKRSILHIDNLCELIRLIILNEENGVFFPQNPEYVKTSDLVKSISKYYNSPIYLTKLANPIINLLVEFGIFKKIFGNFYYQKAMSKYDKGDYQIRNFKNSIELTESKDA